MDHQLLSAFFWIFSGAAALATAALFTRQPMIVAYLALGALLGPYGFGWVTDGAQLRAIGEIGIIFLLFLLGLEMQPRKLLVVLRESLWVGLLSSALFLALGTALALAFAFPLQDALLMGLAVSFSSTIIGIKLLPTTALHHRHIGELVVSLLLLQDCLAIVALVGLAHFAPGVGEVKPLWVTLLALPALLAVAAAGVRFILLPLIARFDVIQEYVFLLAVGWCLGLAQIAEALGLSLELGAFVAGVTLATSPIALFLAEALRPLRDFFLVLFFFTVGAGLNLALVPSILLPALAFSALVLLAKPVIYRVLLDQFKEQGSLAWEVGFRLGQISEFSLLLVLLAGQATLLSEGAITTIQTVAVMTFILSSYVVVLRYPTPIALDERLRRR
jgi:Kef-type K+ transport system membrane component KefB